jgi:deoxyxylulose-5-phosphate synthase
VLELFEELHLGGIQVTRLGIPDVLVEQGTQASMRARYGLTTEGIQAAAEALVKVRRLEPPRGESAA